MRVQFIHLTMTTEAGSEIWDVTNPPQYKDLSTAELEYQEIKEAHNDVSTLSKYQLMTTDKESWYLPSTLMLDIRFKLYKTGTTKFLATEIASLCSDAFSLFNSLELRFNNNQIASVDRPGHLHFAKSLVEYSKNYADSVASNQWFYLDTVSDGVNDEINTPKALATSAVNVGSPIVPFVYTVDGADDVASIINNPNYNEGMRARVRRNGEELQVMLPLREIFPILDQMDRAIRGTRIEVVGHKFKDEEQVMFGDKVVLTTASSVSINSISMWLARVKPSLAIQATVEQALVSNKKVNYTYSHCEMYLKENFSNVGGSQRYRVTTELAQPTHAIVFFQLSSRSTTLGLNPLQFDRVNIDSIHMRLNGKQYPEEEYSALMTLGGSHTGRVVHDIFRLGSKHGAVDGGSLIDVKQWQDVHPFYVFDLSAQEPSALKNATVKDIEVRWTHSATPAAMYDVGVVMFSDREISIDYKAGAMHFTRR